MVHSEDHLQNLSVLKNYLRKTDEKSQQKKQKISGTTI